MIIYVEMNFLIIMSGAFIDKKVALTACVVVGFLLASSMLILFFNNTEEDRQLRLIGRVNTEGSGMYLKSTESATTYIEYDVGTDQPILDGDGNVQYHVSAWGGKVFGTPGTTSIQHMQLQTIVQNSLHLSFKPYDGGELDTGTVYYLPSITNKATFESSIATIPDLVGGIIWEPQYSSLIASGCNKLMLTADFEPGHTCCVIGASHKFITNNPDITVRFLAAYIKTVKDINNALADHASDDYATLVNVAKTQTGISDTSVIESALDIVTYTYADAGYTTGSAPLNGLQTTIENLADTYYSLGGVLKVSMKNLGFSSTHRFAQTFVDDGYLYQAINFGEPSAAGYSKTSISIAYISGDIHTSLALGYGTEKGYFDAYGIVIDMSPAANGAGVATSLQNGEANFGFMGAPPITITSINSKLVEA